MWKQIKWIGSNFASVGQWATSPFRGKTAAAPAGFDGVAVEVPDDTDGKKYVVSKEAGLGDKEKDDRRDAAE